ncbi:MAG: hypothetical protein HDR23_10390 [Lachnospiraceae bacterium]|nr:hypothetical protein [Lachnospiraceae bacterium]
MDKWLETIEITDLFIKTVSGDGVSTIQFLAKVKEFASSIRDIMFYKKVEVLMRELENRDADRREIGKALAKSDYGSECGFALLKYIDDFESVEKGKYLANLLDSLSKGFISTQDCLTYARLLKDVSLTGLHFIKSNIGTKIFDESFTLKELLRFDLVYKVNNGGYAFEYMAYYLDKFALSYCDEKYKYNEEKDYIPSREMFPAKVAIISASQGEPY